MAKSGFVIGFSTSTSISPSTYWGGGVTDQVDDLDDAGFIETLSAARIQAGTLQAQFPENHVEAYSATLTVAFDPIFGATGI